jgi:hypothetical protein
MRYCKQSPLEAEKWARTAIQRAENQGETETLYTAISQSGLLAAQRGDSLGARDALHRLKLLVHKGVPVRFGDEVPFLEASLSLDKDTCAEVSGFAREIASNVEDPEFRSMAELIARKNQ